MVHQREDAQPPRVGGNRLRQTSEGKAVDEDPRSILHAGQRRAQAGSGQGVRIREGPLETVHRDPPAPAPQPGDHPCIVDVAPGLLVQRAGHDQVQLEPGCGHGRPSYLPQATWDSCSVTAIDVIPCAPGPSSPARAADASRSKISRARNSVVVFRPANAGSSSRLR